MTVGPAAVAKVEASSLVSVVAQDEKGSAQIL
jgi:hypothetical protein